MAAWAACANARTGRIANRRTANAGQHRPRRTRRPADATAPLAAAAPTAIGAAPTAVVPVALAPSVAALGRGRGARA
eukprot:11067303-Alexandrium_andersonii.AAC.2